MNTETIHPNKNQFLLWCHLLTKFNLFFAGNALLRRLVRIGVLDESRMKLDYVLSLKVEDFLERRLQTQVFKLGLAKSIHHARVLIRQRHIRYWHTRVLTTISGCIALELGWAKKTVFHGPLEYCFQYSTPVVLATRQILLNEENLFS